MKNELQQQLDEANLKIATLKQYIKVLRDQHPYAWELPSIPPRIVLHPDLNANYGGTVKPLYSAPMPAPEGWKLVPIEPTENMLEVYRTWHNEGLQHMDIGIYKAMLEASPKDPS